MTAFSDVRLGSTTNQRWKWVLFFWTVGTEALLLLGSVGGELETNGENNFCQTLGIFQTFRLRDFYA